MAEIRNRSRNQIPARSPATRVSEHGAREFKESPACTGYLAHQAVRAFITYQGDEACIQRRGLKRISQKYF